MIEMNVLSILNIFVLKKYTLWFSNIMATFIHHLYLLRIQRAFQMRE